MAIKIFTKIVVLIWILGMSLCAYYFVYVPSLLINTGATQCVTFTGFSRAAQAERLKKFPALRGYLASTKKIPGGTFQMGSSRGKWDEKPVHPVTLSAFRMGATPVTVAVWKEYCAATGSKLPEAPSWGFLDDHPVVNVSWDDIMGADGNGGFCAWATDVAGFRVTLPTEAQFAYAARGGHSGWKFPWGNNFDDSKLWCSVVMERNGVASVFRTSNIFRDAYGLTDMIGNVMQWTADQGADHCIDKSIDMAEYVPARRIVRGTAFCRVDQRYLKETRRYFWPWDWQDDIGFRVVINNGNASVPSVRPDQVR